LTLGVLVWAYGCAAAPPPETPEPVAEPGDAAPAPAPPPPPVATPAPPAPTPEEQKKAAEQKKLEEDFAKLEADHRAELARLTPELRKNVKVLAEKAYPSLKAALTAALAGQHRKATEAARDAQRHPQETLALFGIKPNMSVLEYGPGEGWYTELLAPTLAKNGKLYVTSTDPNGPRTERTTLYGLRTKYFLERLPEVYGKVETVQFDPKAPKLGLDGKLDAVVLIRGAHGMYNNKVLDQWLAEFHRALKPKGILGIEQHRAPAGSNVEEMAKKGYLPEAFVIETVEAAGFKLDAKSEVNANAKDTKDHPDGVWSLPPTLRGGEKDKDKYLAIGESDRMTLRFLRVDRPASKPATPASAPAAPAAPAGPKPSSAAPAGPKPSSASFDDKAATPAAPVAPAAPSKPVGK
jgi:predicted methyltransferase